MPIKRTLVKLLLVFSILDCSVICLVNDQQKQPSKPDNQIE
jgi:hypothetical protein